MIDYTVLEEWFPGLKIYRDRKVVTIFLFGFSSGLPIMLIATTLSTWLREDGISRSAIGMFGFVFVPYTLKFIWAPLLDRLPLPPLTTILGRRRGWILFCQLALVFVIWGLGQTNPGVDLWWTAFFALMIGFFSASQDVVIDAYRIDSLPEEHMAAGASVAVVGYRIAMFAATAGALLLAEFAGWDGAYLFMAALMSIGILTTIYLAREPEGSSTALIDEETVKADRLMQDFAGSAQRSGSLGFLPLFFIAFLVVINPLSVLIGLVTPLHSEFGGLFTIYAGLDLLIAFFGAYCGWLMWEKRKEAPQFTKNFVLFSLLWILITLCFYALPDPSVWVGDFYIYGFLSLLYVVVNAVTILFGVTIAHASFVEPIWLLSLGLWVKFFLLIVLYGAFYFSRGFLSLYGVTPIEQENKVHLWTRRAIVEPYYDFFKKNGVQIALVILLLISFFKASDAVLTLLANPLYIDVGFSKEDIAWVSKAFGVWMTMIGSLLGGVICYRIGMLRSMVLATILMSISNLMFVLLSGFGAEAVAISEQAIAQGRELTEAELATRAAIGKSLIPLFYMTIIVENMSGGLGTAIFVAYLSSLCNVQYSATQYALLTSFMQMLAKFIIVPSSGFFADAVGWNWFFIASTLFAIPTLLLIWWLSKLQMHRGIDEVMVQNKADT